MIRRSEEPPRPVPAISPKIYSAALGHRAEMAPGVDGTADAAAAAAVVVDAHGVRVSAVGVGDGGGRRQRTPYGGWALALLSLFAVPDFAVAAASAAASAASAGGVVVAGDSRAVGPLSGAADLLVSSGRTCACVPYAFFECVDLFLAKPGSIFLLLLGLFAIGTWLLTRYRESYCMKLTLARDNSETWEYVPCGLYRTSSRAGTRA